MAGLKSLIRLKRHELDNTRRMLGELLDKDETLKREARRVEDEYQKEKSAAESDFNLSYTFGPYAERVRQKQRFIAASRKKLAEQIEKIQEQLQQAFRELKTIEITEAERERKKQAAQKKKEDSIMDDIGVEGFRRRKEKE